MSNIFKPEKVTPRLIICHGSPGRRLATTYGNIGYLFADYSYLRAINILPTQASRIWVTKSKYQFNVIANEPLTLLIKPRTLPSFFDNLARDLYNYYRPPPSDMYIAYPDSGIAFGEYLVDTHLGSFAPENVAKLEKTLPFANFYKIRLGIGKAQADEQQLTEHDLVIVKTMSYKIGEEIKIIPKLGENL